MSYDDKILEIFKKHDICWILNNHDIDSEIWVFALNDESFISSITSNDEERKRIKAAYLELRDYHIENMFES